MQGNENDISSIRQSLLVFWFIVFYGSPGFDWDFVDNNPTREDREFLGVSNRATKIFREFWGLDEQ